MLLSDRVTGSAVTALGAACAYAGSKFPPVPGQEVGPSAFPTLIGILLVVCGLLIAFGVGHSFEEEADADVAASETAHGAAHPRAPRWGGALAALPPALLVFYALVVERLGFVPTTFLMIVAMVGAFGGKLRLALILGIVGPVLIHAIFYKLLRVPLPSGILPMPWS